MGSAGNAASEQDGGCGVVGGLDGHIKGLGRESAWRGGLGEAFGNHGERELEELKQEYRSRGEQPHAVSIELAAARAKEQTLKPADGTRPEVKGVLQTLLEAGDEEIIKRLKAMEAAMAAAECTQPEIGRLIENYYVPLLMSVLELDDEEFEAEYPDEKQVTPAQRADFAEIIDRHSLECRRCQIKAASDYAWDEHFNEILKKKSAENNPEVLVHKHIAFG